MSIISINQDELLRRIGLTTARAIAIRNNPNFTVLEKYALMYEVKLNAILGTNYQELFIESYLSALKDLIEHNKKEYTRI